MKPYQQALGRLILCVATVGAPCAASAQAYAGPTQTPPVSQEGAPEMLRMFLEKETSGIEGRVEVSIGNPDSRLHLAPCRNMQPFVPSGARLWGRTMLGIRCIEGAAWQVFLPATIRIFGRAPVVAHAMNAGDALSEADIRFEEVELTRYPIGAFADPAQLADKQAGRPLRAGEPLLRDQLRARQVLAAGDSVKLIYSGKGFAVTTQARALSGATLGQNVRVVTESGRTISGTAREGRIVELMF